MNAPKIRLQATVIEETPRGPSRPQNPNGNLPSSCSNVVAEIETGERAAQPPPVPAPTHPQQTPQSPQRGQISVEYVQRATTTVEAILEALQKITGKPLALNSHKKFSRSR